MAGVEVRVDDAAVRAALERLARFAGAPREALADIGEYMQRVVDDRFAAGRNPEGRAWERNSAATLLRKRNPRILHESPLLRGSIHYRATDDALAQGTRLEYAAVQQFGARQGAFGRTRRNVPIPWGDIPARPFLGFNAADRAEVMRLLEAHIRERFEDAEG
ncbi:putative bacteriophage protein [Thioalkalivibrio sulfidiphilus HL-EbGr7]|uniref:Putative bacteriophage protein n=1 Tax=Thioalkalivibrio sulfidiphilus (strain HL-EbGR7) TaxID=396588 RepID=B8GS18_THISH|nr:phage virion morphogenesis protein [Thioalkalivibrio sulfidiphilus]ACL72722.1 putative bacteriophage protein [Thioalkalivibrio sulfidiphilus HL-EbGr7]